MGIIGDEDLRAREARYHASCRKEYTRKETRCHDNTKESELSFSTVKADHARCFHQLCEYVQQQVINCGHVVRMSMLRDRYIDYMLKERPDTCNVNYPTQKLKAKLVFHFGESLQFWLPSNRCKSELVYSADIDVGEAIESAFDANASDASILLKAANILSCTITAAHNSASSVPFPPQVSDLQEISPPTVVTDFVARVLAGPSCPSHRYSSKVMQIAKSLSEDLCYGATRGQWKMPKHIELAVSLHHLTGSAEVVTLINRFGHCVSYSKLLELETSLAYAVQQNDSVLPSNISVSNNAICHTCWDNFDLNEETLSGAGTTHTTHGIVIQEVSGDSIPAVHVASEDVPVKLRSFQYVPPPLRCASIMAKAEPAVSGLKVMSHDASMSAFRNSRGLLWVLSHGLFSAGSVPDWSGWLSQTADKDDNGKLSQIGYLKPVMNPITKISTVQQCLHTSIEISQKLGQQYTFVTFDLAAAKLA